MKKNDAVDREVLLNLAARERELLANYEKLCEYYQVDPHPVAKAKAEAKIEILEYLINYQKNSLIDF